MSETVFVGREQELKKLDTFLGRVLEHHGQVVFVTGEAGSGKTALVRAFAVQAKIAHDDLLVALGSCNAQGGIGDPYLPFREVLADLTGITEESKAPRATPPAEEPGTKRLKNLLVRSTKVLLELGPDLIGTLVPGSYLMARFGLVVAQKTGVLNELERLVRREKSEGSSSPSAVDQSHIFEQYASVLVALSNQQPLLIIMDDLHWADDASISLLFHLSRRIEHSRVLIIGTYRPDEVALPRGDERHPLEKVLAEIRRYVGDCWIDLGLSDAVSGRTFVDQIVDREPNRLDESFRQALYEHANGHALFMVELLRTFQERGDLVRDAQGHWIAEPTLNWQAGTIPARVEGAVAERLGRLKGVQRELLRTASVEGVNFTGEVVAQVLQMPLRQVFSELSHDLEKRHQLVRERGIIKAGRQRLAGYQFTHELIRKVLYNELGGAEQRLLNDEVARAMEQFFAEELDIWSAQLAWYYEQAGEDDRAIQYLCQAARRALAVGANSEAQEHLEHGLALLDDASSSAGRLRLDLHQLLGDALQKRGDFAHAQAHYEESLSLANVLSNQAVTAGALLGLAGIALAQGERAIAKQRFQDTLAHAADNPEQRGMAIQGLGRVAESEGDYSGAADYFRRGLDIYRQAGNRHGIASCLNSLCSALIHLGDYAAAKDYGQQSLVIKREIGDRMGISTGLNNLATIAYEEGDYAMAEDYLQQSLAIDRVTGVRFGAAISMGNLAGVCLKLGRLQEALRWLQEGLQLTREMAAVPLTLYLLGLAASWRLQSGQPLQAAEWAGLAAQHPLTESDDRHDMERLRRELEAAMAPDVVAAAWARGQTLELDQVVAQVMVLSSS